MTPKQMYRAMRKWGISVAWDRISKSWYAGDAAGIVSYVLHVNVSDPTVSRMHKSDCPESAVEDYCNARNLEWDV